MKHTFKVGIFVLMGLLLLALGVFLIGDHRRMWESKVVYRASFRDVAGLKPGAPVRSGGIDIGTVDFVGHGQTASDMRVYVRLAVVRGEASRIRKGTIARVQPKGLLGDKMVELFVPDEATTLHNPDELLLSEEPKDMFADANAIASKASKLLDKLEPLANELGDARLHQDIRGTVKSLDDVVDAVAHKDSTLHRLIYDEAQAKKVDQIVQNLALATDNLNGLLGNLRDVSGRVRTGPGLLHSLAYSGDLSDETAGVLREVHKDLRAVREGNGIAHALVYGDDSTQAVMGNLHAISTDIRHIVAGVRAGKGTLGGLLVDPSIYEDIKALVGNVERNQVLRALVRYSIKKDEEKKPPKVEPTKSP